MITTLRALAAAAIALLPIAASAQTVRPENLPQGFVILVEDQSQAATASTPIYMASGANSWDPGDPDFKLEPRSDKRWQIVIEPGTLGENVEFKFTLGGWNTVELDAEGQEIANRTLPDVDRSSFAQGERPVIEFTIPRFRSGNEQYVIARDYRPLEVTGTVKRLQVASGAGKASRAMRDLLVWLPPGYDDEANADTDYPVLYMMDGQNIFTDHALIPGEWRADETATALIEAGLVRPFIIVGVPHGGADARVGEYMPAVEGSPSRFADQDFEAADHLRWLTGEVMPRVERAFRVSRQPSLTGIGGASAGGTFALYAGLTTPDRFGLVLAESPVLMLKDGDQDLWNMTSILTNAQSHPGRVYLGMGGDEHIPETGFFNRETKPHMRAAIQLTDFLDDKTDVALNLVTDHAHDENAWADRLPAALLFLLSPEASEDQSSAAPAAGANMIDPQDWPAGFIIVARDSTGRASESNPVTIGSNINNWNPGDDAWVMTQRADGAWVYHADPIEADARMEFKFTLGSWDTVETNPDGSERDNRTLPEIDASNLRQDQKPVVEFEIQKFREQARLDTRDFSDPSRPLDVTGTVERVTIAGGAGRAAHAQRDLLVWLPEGAASDAATADRRYPLLLLMDGQNVFEHAPGLPGEWHADETATQLIAEGAIEPVIIVGVPNTGRSRADEYIPTAWGSLQGVEPAGEHFIQWLADTVLPTLREQYPIARGPEHVTIGGASLGGLISLAAVMHRPDTFGSAIAESVSMLSADGKQIRDGIAKRLNYVGTPRKLWIGMGGREVSFSETDTQRNADYRDWAESLGHLFRDAGMTTDTLRVEIVEPHHHHEPAWAERLPDAMRFVYAD